MYSRTPTVTLDEKFKNVIYLAGEYNLRHVKLAEQISKVCRITLVSTDKSYSAILTKSGINFYHFKGLMDKWSNLTYEFYCFRLAQYIGAYNKKNNITDNEILFILNNLDFSSLLSYFQHSRVHFDCTEALDDDGMLMAYKNKLFSRIKTSTVPNMKLLKSLEATLRPVYKISNGIDIDIINKHTAINNSTTTQSGNFAGCYCPYPELMNYELIQELALANPQISFVFLSDKVFNISTDLPTNISYIVGDKVDFHFDLIILPFKDEEPDKLVESFFLNLIHKGPVISLENKEFLPYQSIIKLMKSKDELIHSIADNIGKPERNSLEKQILIDRMDWNGRLKSLESIILAYS